MSLNILDIDYNLAIFFEPRIDNAAGQLQDTSHHTCAQRNQRSFSHCYPEPCKFFLKRKKESSHSPSQLCAGNPSRRASVSAGALMSQSRSPPEPGVVMSTVIDIWVV